MRRARRKRRAWMCPYAVVSLQTSIGGFGPKKPLPKRCGPKGRWGGGERGPWLADVQSCAIRSVSHGAPPRARPSVAPHGVTKGAASDIEPRPERALVRTTVRARPRENPRRRLLGEPGDEGCVIAARKGGGRAAHPLSNGRRLWPGKVAPCHDGGAEAALAAFAESECARPRKKGAPVSSEVRDRGVRGTSSQGVEGTKRPPRNLRDLPKRCGAS